MAQLAAKKTSHCLRPFVVLNSHNTLYREFSVKASNFLSIDSESI